MPVGETKCKHSMSNEIMTEKDEAGHPCSIRGPTGVCWNADVESIRKLSEDSCQEVREL